MNLHTLLIFCLILGLVRTVNAQDDRWPLVVAEGHITFDLPPTMEVDSASFEFSQNADGRDVYTLRPEELTIMTGSRQDESDRSTGTRRAANLIVDIDEAEPGAYAPLGADLGLTQQDVEQLNEEMRVGFSREAAQKNDLREIEWGGTYILSLDEAKAINLRLKGLAGDTGEKYVVNIYIIQNYDAIYYITLSYLDSEAQAWIPDLTSAFQSIRFVRRDGEQ
ncbi:MAG: hypothetical protein PVF33_10690 [Candidatus Latescibacterota bacterium]